MVSFADLRDARISPLNAAASAWEQFAGKQRKLEQQVIHDLAGPLRAGDGRATPRMPP